MSNIAQIGQLQFGQNQFNGWYSLTDYQDIISILGTWRTQYGWGQVGRRRFSFPERWTLRSISGAGEEVVEISITSFAGSVLGKIRTDIQKTIVNSIEFTIDQNGCADFVIKLNSLPDFPILPFSIASIKVGNSSYDWYAGEISYSDDIGVDQEIYEYRGVGLRTALEGLRADTTYVAGSDVGEIVKDLAETWIEPYCSINYNSSKIITNTGVIIANDIELSKLTLNSVLDTLAAMGNCDWGVDGDKDLFFQAKDSSTIQRTFFVGYNINNFKPKLNLAGVKNVITVQRQEGKGSGGAGWSVAGVYNDVSSVKKYGRKELNYQIPGYFGDDEADIIGEALLAEKKEPALSGTIDGFLVHSANEFLTRGPYRIIMPYDEYNYIHCDVDDATEWTQAGGGDLVISKDTDYFIYGDGSLKLTFTSSLNAYAELSKSFSLGEIKKIKFFIRANILGKFLRVGIGYGAWNQYTSEIDIPAIDKFSAFEWDIESLGLTIIDSFGIQITDVLTSEANVYIDKIEILVKGHKYYTMIMSEAKYKFSPTDQSCSIELGSLPPKMENYLAGLFATANELKFVSEIR